MGHQTAEQIRAYREKHKAEINARQRARYAANKPPAKPKEQDRARKLRVLYNMTPEDYARLLAYQGNKCPITLKPFSRTPNVDHRHSDGLIRGLLDWRANRSLAGFGDDPAMLRRAADYLERPPAVVALGEPTYGVIGRMTRKAANRRYGPHGDKEPTVPERRKRKE